MIVRNTCYTWLRQNRAHEILTAFDEEIHSAVGHDASNAETAILPSADDQLVRQAMDDLPVEVREVVILRELEALSYKEIAVIADIPMGTVMSRLARARERLEQSLADRMKKEV